MTEQAFGKHDRVLGPVDYVIIRFPGNKFTGAIAPELIRLERVGIIRVIDLVFVLKDPEGNLVTFEAHELEGEAGEAFRDLTHHTSEWFSEPDIGIIAEMLPNNSSAVFLLFENLWAAKLKEGLLAADAELVDMGRIPQEIIMKAKTAMTQAGGN